MTLRKLKLNAPIVIKIEAIAEGQLQVHAIDLNTGRELLTNASVGRESPLRGITFHVVPDGLIVSYE